MYDLESGNSWFAIDLTIVSHDFNEPKIIQIGQIEAKILAISICAPKPIDLYRNTMFFDFSSDVTTDSLRYVKFINLHKKQWYKRNISLIDYSAKYVVIYKAQKERKITVFYWFSVITVFLQYSHGIVK